MAAGLDATPPPDRPCDVARTDASNVQWSERWCSADPESSDTQLPPPAARSSSEARQAVAYTLKNWTALARYCENPDLSIDNNATDRALRRFAVAVPTG